MHVLFVHQNFPAQFGQIARHLVRRHGFQCTFVSQRPASQEQGVRRIQYHVRGGATSQTHYCSRTFENGIWHAHAVYQALKAAPEVRPDLVVGHSGFGSTIFLRELYECPVINYYEYFYRTRGGDLDFRPDFPVGEMDRLRARARNAMILLDLDNADAGYCPTRWQHGRLPGTYADKVRVIFDGIDTQFWRPRDDVPRRVAGRVIPPQVKLVTYVSRGMESMRGFDLFMKAAKRIAQRRRDVLFVVVGEDQICYGGDQKYIGQDSFKEWVLAQDDYPLERFLFTGRLPPDELAKLFSLADLHVYLTVPFVLSWSLMNALACGTTVLASATGPVREMIDDGVNGLLVDFFDVDGLVAKAEEVLGDPAAFDGLGRSARARIQQHYSLDVCLPRMLQLYQDTGCALPPRGDRAAAGSAAAETERTSPP